MCAAAATLAEMGSKMVFVVWLLFDVIASQSTDIKGPPIAQQKEMKKIVRLGEDVKITCPILGNPTPIVEWKKGGETIDYSWIRIRTQKKSLKIRRAQEEDTGVYVCKGVNGFGNVEVRVDLIIIDPSKFPELKEGELPDVSPPTFTQETLDTKDFYSKQSGDAFKVNCEATGNPRPEIFWYKDGLPFDADGIKYKNGKSTLKLRNLMKVDSALYTCLARNLIGSSSKNFTLNVEVAQLHLPEDPPAMVIGGNDNISVLAGDTASLQCRVNSRAPPHIKWLKKQSPDAPSDMFTINVGEERYRVIHTGEDIPVGADEYLNKLVIVNAQESDSGMYICFVTNSGGSFNYKPSFLMVYPASSGAGGITNAGGDRLGRPDSSNQPGTAVVGSPGGPGSGESTHVLALVVCLGVTVVLILIFIIVCVVRKSTKAAGGGSTPDSPEVVRNLMAPSRSTQSSSTITTVASHKFDQPLPPPPSMWASASLLLKSATGSSAGGGPDYMGGGVTRDFASLHENSSTNLLSDRESPVSVTGGGNQYEVPYCHSVGTLGSRYSVPHPPQPQHGGTMPAANNSTPGVSEQGGIYPFRHYPYFQYLNDYDSY